MTRLPAAAAATLLPRRMLGGSCPGAFGAASGQPGQQPRSRADLGGGPAPGNPDLPQEKVGAAFPTTDTGRTSLLPRNADPAHQHGISHLEGLGDLPPEWHEEWDDAPRDHGADGGHDPRAGGGDGGFADILQEDDRGQKGPPMNTPAMPGSAPDSPRTIAGPDTARQHGESPRPTPCLPRHVRHPVSRGPPDLPQPLEPVVASLIRDPGGRKRVQFIAGDGSRRAVRLGKVEVRHAETVRVRIESLVSANVTGQPLDKQTAEWVTTLDDVLYARIAAVGLLKPRHGRTVGGGWTPSRSPART